MADFIKLGTSGTALRDYQLLDQSNYNAGLANPFAANINTSSQYGELESYSEWVMDDWQAGVGKRRPEAGGALYAHMDTRFPNQMILPMGWSYPYAELSAGSGTDYAAGDHTVIVGAKVSAPFRMTPVAHGIVAAWVYVDAADGTTITVDVYTNSNGKPSVSAIGTVGTGTVTKLRPGPVWAKVEMDSTQLLANTDYHIVVSGSAVLTLPKVTPTHGSAYTYSAGVWTAAAAGFQFITGMVTTENNLSLESGVGESLLMEDEVEFLLLSGDDMLGWTTKAGERYFGAYSNRMVELNSDGTITLQVSVDNTITDLIAFGDQIVICHGNGYKVFNTSDDTTDTYTEDATLMIMFGGYLWRAYQNDIYYSADGTTWVQVEDIVGPDGYEIRGMAGMGEYLYMSTDTGLYSLMPGNYVYPVVRWPTSDERNGRGMVEWNGALYIPLAEDIVRYSQDGSMLQVGLRTGEELPTDIQGEVFSLQPTNYFLLASMRPSNPDGYGSLWAYNEQGWHGIGLMPQGVSGGGIYLDTTVNPGLLLWGGDYGILARGNYPSNVVNPIRDRGTKLFSRHGWIEHDRFYGGYVSLDKDWESVYLDTENMVSATISIYWQDQDSTDWELLDSNTTEDFEERWSIDGGVRPNSKWLRLGLLFRTDDESNTPIVRAHRVKFHTMTADRWRWTMALVLSGTETQMQQKLDGTMQAYTGEQMRTHLEGLIKQVPPFVLQDIDGTQYEAKVVQASRTILRQEYFAGQSNYQYLYTIVLEQVVSSVYA